MRRIVLTLILGLLLSPLAFADPPDQSGPFVVRYDFEGFEYVFWVFNDQEQDFFWATGIDFSSWCMGGESYDVATVQEVDLPSFINAVVQLVQADDVTIAIWDGVVPNFGTACEVATTIEPMAFGTVDMILNDNDYFSFDDPDTRRFNSYGFNAHGVLHLQDGDRAIFNGHYRCVWDGHFGEFARCNLKTTLR